MPRPGAGPKLWLDKKRDSWTIIDGRRRSRTGFRAHEIGPAKKALSEYLARQHLVSEFDPEPFVSDVLATYSAEHLAGKISEKHILYDIAHLTKWWGDKRVSEINAKTCQAYAAKRKVGPSVRRELAFLRAALGHWDKHHAKLRMPTIVLPRAPEPRSHFMTRQEAARFLWQARHVPQVARFFIIGWYTGSRRSVITGLRWSMIDLTSGIMHRKLPGAAQTKKRAPPVRMGARLMAHLARWKRLDGKGADYVITFKGKPIWRNTRAWVNVRTRAGLPPHITPHILRHTRATFMLQQGIDIWTASQALGMSPAVLARVYGHHHPDWQKAAAEVR